MHDDERRGDRPDELPGGRGDTAPGVGAALVDLVGALAGPVLTAAGTVLTLGLRISRIGVGERVLAGLADRGGQVRAELAGAMRATVRRLVLAVVDVVDLTELVRLNVDLDALAREIDVDAVVARADLDAAVSRADLNAVVARVDLDAVVARLDLAGIAREVIHAIDLPEIIRQSRRALSSETVHGLRAEGMYADDAVARFVGRVLRRPGPERPALQ